MRWPTLEIGRACLPTEQSDPSRTPDSYFWYIDIASVDRNSKNITGAQRILGNEAPSRARKVIHAGDVLVSTVRPNLNTVAIVPEHLDGEIASTGFCVLRPNSNLVDGKYLFYKTVTTDFVSHLVARMKGANYPAVTDGTVKNALIPLPSLSEQHRIVEILDQADQLRKLRAEADKKTERILPALFNKMFGDPATNPMGWPVVSLGDQEIAEINPRTTAKNTVGTTAVSFVPMADVDEVWGRIVGTQTRMYEEVSKGFTSFKEGDVIFAKITPCMQNGKAAIARGLVNGIGFGSTEFHVLRPGCKATAEWIYCLVRMIHFRNAATQSFTGSGGQQRVPTSFLREYSLPLPSMERQLEFGKLVQDVNNRVPKLQNVKDKIEGLFANLLQRAFSGALTASWREAHMKELLAEMELQAKYLN